MSYLALLKLAAPETILVLAALAVLAADALALRGVELPLRRLISAMIACAGCVAAVGWMLVLPQSASSQQGMFFVDPLTQFVKMALLALTFFTIVLSIDTEFTTHTGEYFALVLFATVGMMFLVSSADVLMIFIALELTSLSLYILTAFNKRNPKSAEAALKYFLFGGMAAAFTLFGLSWLYGITGSTNLAEISRVIIEESRLTGSRSSGSIHAIDPLLAGALVMTIVGFGFKIAAAPFHLWAPDAYEGAPTPSATLIASGSKVAGFFIFAKVMVIGFTGLEGSVAWHHFAPGWMPVLAVLASLSMVLGNLAAIVQNSVRRLLAYSAIAHAGYLLLGILSGKLGQIPLLYYVITYGLTTLGAFGVVSIVQERAGDRLVDFAGLSRRAPVLSFCMLIFLLSLAGIPPMAGFFGKFFLFATLLAVGWPKLGSLWLVALAVGTSAVSLYYYLRVLKQIYVVDPPASAVANPIPILSQIVVALLALAVVILGCAPWLLTDRLAFAIAGQL